MPTPTDDELFVLIAKLQLKGAATAARMPPALFVRVSPTGQDMLKAFRGAPDASATAKARVAALIAQHGYV